MQNWNQSPTLLKDYCGKLARAVYRVAQLQAFTAPHGISNPKKCISYLTLEKRVRVGQKN